MEEDDQLIRVEASLDLDRVQSRNPPRRVVVTQTHSSSLPIADGGFLRGRLIYAEVTKRHPQEENEDSRARGLRGKAKASSTEWREARKPKQGKQKRGKAGDAPVIPKGFRLSNEGVLEPMCIILGTGDIGWRNVEKKQSATTVRVKDILLRISVFLRSSDLREDLNSVGLGCG